jgi:hypothetical protein
VTALVSLLVHTASSLPKSQVHRLRQFLSKSSVSATARRRLPTTPARASNLLFHGLATGLLTRQFHFQLLLCIFQVPDPVKDHFAGKIGLAGNRCLQFGDLVSLDVGVVLDGYYGDSALTVPVGEISESTQRLLRTTEEALELAVEKARLGNRLGDISATVQQYVEANGYSVVREFVGHGIGRELHEEPQIPNFGSPGLGPARCWRWSWSRAPC